MSSLASMLLTLPAGNSLLELEPGQYAPVESAVHNLRSQAINKAIAARECGRIDLAEQWQTVSAIAKLIARKFKSKTRKYEKADLTAGLMVDMGFAGRAAPVNNYVGMSAFQAPSVEHAQCVVEASQLAFAPWVDYGDLISVDFTATALSYDGLYLVAVHGEHMAIRGFRQHERKKWLLYENMQTTPVPLRMSDILMPADFEIVGRILDIYKKQPTDKKACAARRSA